MDVLGDIVVGLLGAGRRRATSQPRPVDHVRPTRWLVVGIAAVTAQALTLVAVLAVVGRFAWMLATDDLLLGLSAIVLPLAMAGLGVALSVMGRMAGIVRKLLARDVAARVELAVVGFGGIFIGGWISMLGLAVPGLAVLVPATASAVVAAVPEAWRPDERR